MTEGRQAELAALRYLEENRSSLYAMLSRLIKFDSQNLCGDGREEACAAYLAAQYRELGLQSELYLPDEVPGVRESPLYWPGQNTDRRPNAAGRLPGEGLPVMLAAHTDTMPVGDPEAWTVDPFAGCIRDGKIYGLGACDNKFGLAGSFFALKAILATGGRPRRPVVLAAYCDEEYGGGNGALAACLHDPSEVCVNLDGGNYELWASALGGGCYRLRLHRDEPTDNWEYIYEALRAVLDGLREFGARRRAELEQNPLYRGTATARSAFRLGKFGTVGENHVDAQLEFVLYTDRAREEIEAGLAAVQKGAEETLRRCGVRTAGFEPTSRFFDYGVCDQQSAAFRTMRACAEEASGEAVRVCGSCLTDLSVIQRSGAVGQSFNFGILRDFSLPGGAHQPNEFVDCAQFLNHTKALALFLLRYGGETAEERKKGETKR